MKRTDARPTGGEPVRLQKLLADSGDRQIANTLVRQLAQRWTQWDADPAHLYAVRDRIAERLNGKALFCRRPDGLPESPRAPGTVRRPL